MFYRLLGITIDHELSFDDHVDSLCGKLAQRIGILRSIRSLLHQNERVLLYNTTIKPILMYGSSIWGSITSKQNLTRLLNLQKRAARVILNKNNRESRTVDLFKSLNWLPFDQEIKANQCSLLMKRLQGQVLEYLEPKLTRIGDVSTRATRHSRKTFYCPRYNQETEGGRTFIAKAVKLWNSLPDKLKDCPNVKSFMTAHTSHFAAMNADLVHFIVN